jgi:hypothetical protein
LHQVYHCSCVFLFKSKAFLACVYILYILYVHVFLKSQAHFTNFRAGVEAGHLPVQTSVDYLSQQWIGQNWIKNKVKISKPGTQLIPVGLMSHCHKPPKFLGWFVCFLVDVQSVHFNCVHECEPMYLYSTQVPYTYKIRVNSYTQNNLLHLLVMWSSLTFDFSQCRPFFNYSSFRK